MVQPPMPPSRFQPYFLVGWRRPFTQDLGQVEGFVVGTWKDAWFALMWRHGHLRPKPCH